MGKKNKMLEGYRTMAGYNQDDMANIAEMNRVTYCRKESGKASFTDKEMTLIFNALERKLKYKFPELKITDIFFDNVGA